MKTPSDWETRLLFTLRSVPSEEEAIKVVKAYFEAQRRQASLRKHGTRDYRMGTLSEEEVDTVE